MLVDQVQAIALARRQPVNAAYSLVQAARPRVHGAIVFLRRSTARCSQVFGKSEDAKFDEIFHRSTAPSVA